MKFPSVNLERGPDAIHAYPYAVGILAQRFMQAAYFHGALVEFGMGQFMGTKESYRIMKHQFTIKLGLDEEIWDAGKACYEEYLDFFPNPIASSVLLSLNAHWDWFIRRIGEFVEFSIKHVVGPPLKPKDKHALKRIGRSSLLEQLKVLEAATGFDFAIHPEVLESVEEMMLVRNLGQHNEWVVDDDYVHRSRLGQWSHGEIRSFDLTELNKWSKAMLELMDKVSVTLAERYANVPDFNSELEFAIIRNIDRQR